MRQVGKADTELGHGNAASASCWVQVILVKAIAVSLQKQHASAELLACARVRLLQRFVAINPLSAAALAAEGITAQHVAAMSTEELTTAAHSLGLPPHSLQLMQQQIHWGQPLDDLTGTTALEFMLCDHSQPSWYADEADHEAQCEHASFEDDDQVLACQCCSSIAT